MSDPITNRAVQLLTAEPHILVSVEDLYLALESEGLMVWTPFGVFVELIASDYRMTVSDGLSDIEIFDTIIREELELRGLLLGPLVMLRARAISSRALMHDVLAHLQEMNEALEIAWQLRSPDEPEVKAGLLDMLMMGDMLERELKYALNMDIYAPPSPKNSDDIGNCRASQ